MTSSNNPRRVMLLTGRAAVVTGGSKGIGKAIAYGLAAEGVNVVLLARGKELLEKTASAIRSETGVRVLPIPTDVRSTEGVKAAADTAAREFSTIHILVNNAGINIRKPAHELSLAEWRQVIDTNLTSAFVASKAVYPHMLKQGGGKIINIGSMMSIFGASFVAPYGASKGGIVQLTRALACAWARDNIQANAVLPGWIDTALTQRARKDIAGLHENVLRRTPAGRWGEPADFAGIAVFLAAAASDFVTGAAITVDGGYSVLG